MSCVLRVIGKELNIKELLKINEEVETYWEKGKERLSPSKMKKRKHLNSGANYLVSDADFNEFKIQKQDAISYLIENKVKINMMQSLKGIDGIYLDFGIEMRDVAVQCDSLSPELIKIAGELGLGIEMSYYPES